MPESVSDPVGCDEGDVCNRDGCQGVMFLPPVRDCSCHINPPRAQSAGMRWVVSIGNQVDVTERTYSGDVEKMTIRVIQAGVIPNVPMVEWVGRCENCGCLMVSDEFPAKSPPAPPAPYERGSAELQYDPKRLFFAECKTCGKSTMFEKRTISGKKNT